MKAIIPILATLGLALAGCTGIPNREANDTAKARYMDYAGAPVDHFTTLGRFDGWHAIGNDKLIVWSGMKDAYLLTVSGPCNELQFATRIALTSSVAGTVRDDQDSVRIRGARCRITEIRPIDYQAMSKAK